MTAWMAEKNEPKSLRYSSLNGLKKINSTQEISCFWLPEANTEYIIEEQQQVGGVIDLDCIFKTKLRDSATQKKSTWFDNFF